MPQRLRELLALATAMLIGIAVFFAFCGWWPLIPTNIAWLDHADRAMHQLGWTFYRDAPWGLPPGSSPALGLELATSISLVDGLPLVAMPLKLIEGWLPRPFQYWGYWLLLSFTLQSVFAYLIARAFGAHRGLALIAAGFAVITPAFLFRVPLHMALSSHFVVLAALWLYVRAAPPRIWVWPLLLAVTAAIHATLLAMVIAIWGASLLERVWTRRVAVGRIAAEIVLAAAATLATLWLVGFFGTGSYNASGYGAYKLNLLWPILSYRWSELFPDLPHTRFDYEGLSFLGIGILALLIVAAASGAMAALRSAVTPRWLPLMLALAGLMLFAFSKSISFGSINLFAIPMPPFIEALGSAFRSTGRFVWPLLYIVTIGAVVLVGRRLRAVWAVPVAALAFAVQAADSWPEAYLFRQRMPEPSPVWSTTLVSPLWERAAAAGYNRIRGIPVRTGSGHDWKEIGDLAVRHGMATDIAYLARYDRQHLSDLRAAARRALTEGSFEPRTIYILDLASALNAAAYRRPEDLLATVDDRIVFIRNGRALADGLDLFPFAPD